jgi:signal transduction histidine kinase
MHSRPRHAWLAVVPLLAIAPASAVERNDVSDGTAPGATAPTSIATIRGLPLDALAANPPVVIRGVVTRSRPSSLFVEDDSAGIYVNVARARIRGVMPDHLPPPEIPFGSEVEIEGIADPGGFSPIILPRAITLRNAGTLPPPRPFAPERLFAGAEDSQFGSVEGVVEHVADHDDHWRLAMRFQGRSQLIAAVTKESLATAPDRLIDAVARVTGPTASLANARGEFLAPIVFVERPDWFSIVVPPPHAPFDAPEQPLSRLAGFRPAGHEGHMVRTRGTVIHAVPGKTVHLQDGASGIWVATDSSEPLAVGDLVEAAGFLDRDRRMTGLAHAVVRRLDSGPPPRPFPITPAAVLDLNRKAVATGMLADPGDYEGCLVRFVARLLDVRRTADSLVLTLGTESTPLFARLTGWPAADPPTLAVGSELSVTGILDLGWQLDPLAWEKRGPGNLSLLVRAPEDIVVTHRPSPWTPRRLALLLGATGAALTIAIMWAESLRRKGTQLERMVDERTRELVAAAAREAESEERQRAVLQKKLRTSLAASAVAHEIKQPLAHLLLTCRLEADRGTVDGPQAEVFETIAADAERITTTIEKMSVLLRNVETEHRPVNLERVVENSLLQVRRMAANQGIEIRYTPTADACVVEGDEVQLQLAMTNLLRNSIEAIVNDHGEQREIEVAVGTAGPGARLVVGDSGPGWSGGDIDDALLSTTKPQGTGIGLFVAKTAADNHGGTLEVGRSPLGGAEFRLVLPRARATERAAAKPSATVRKDFP